MAQLVERTLGKGEVPSSILGISTSGQNLFNSLNCQRFSLNFNSSKFFKNFCEFGLFKPFNDFQLSEKVANSQNYTEINDFLSEKKSNFLSNAVGDLSIIGILYKEQLNLKLSSTLKVFLSILTNLCKSSQSNFIDYSNNELLSRVHGLFSLVQIRRHIEKLNKLGLISVSYGQNSSRKILLSSVNNFAGKFISISSIYTESGASKLMASEILVFSYLLDKSSFFAKADLGFFTDSDDATQICKELNISDRTLRNAYASLIELKAIAYCSDASKKSVKAVNISDDISSQYAKKFNITSSEHCRKIVLKRCKAGSSNADISSMTNDSLKSLLLSLKAKKHFGKKCRFPQGDFGKKGSQNSLSLEKNDLSINIELNDHINNVINNAQLAVDNTYKLNLKSDPIGIRVISPSQSDSCCWLVQVKPGSHAELDLKLNTRFLTILHKINGIDLQSSSLSVKDINSMLNQKKVTLQVESVSGIYQNVKRTLELTRNI